MRKKPEIFQILKGLYLDELTFIADRLSRDRQKWKYDKRSKSSIRSAVVSNVDEESLSKVLTRSLGQKMSSGDSFPDILQIKKIVLGPLGFQKSVESRTRYDAGAIATIFNRHVRGSGILEKVAKETKDRISDEILDLITGIKGVFYKPTLIQLILTCLTDKEICGLVNNLLANREIDIDVVGSHEDIEFQWIITPYGLMVVPEDEPIENLARLLREYHDEDDLEPELRLYSGDFRTRLLEYCIMDDPKNILQRLFSLPELRQIAKKLGFVSTKIGETSEAISLVLLGLGFSVPPNLVGISTYTKSIQRCRKDLSEARDDVVKSGTMSQVFTTTERALRDLTYFYIAFLWKKQLEDLESKVEAEMPDLNSRQVKAKSLDIFIRRRFRIRKNFERLGFGDFVSLIKIVNSAVGKSELFRMKLSKSFDRTHLLQGKEIKILESISPYRSSFTHTKDYPGDEKCDEIVGLIEGLLRNFQDGKIYPLIIRISKEVRDEYGRSSAECIDEYGEKWLVYTEEILEPSQPYFLFSKTPRIAVNPVVIEKIF
jgi:hypothetical protein